MSRSDQLAGLLNRRGFNEAAISALEKAHGENLPAVALMCDIDRFKTINDQFGHEFGDAVLVQVGEVLNSFAKGHDILVGRHGGEEFVALVIGATSEEAMANAEKLRLACAEKEVSREGALARVTISIGLAGLRMNLLPKDAPASQTQMFSSIGRAALLLMNQNYEGGRQAFQTLFAQYPQLPGLHYLYGYLIFATKPDEAVEQFGKELQISPHSANAHAMRAWALELQGDYTAALEDATKASTEDPSLSMGQLVYGRALVETGEISAGLPHLENVLRTEPANLEAHLTLAKAYSKLGRSEEARRERLLCLSISQQGAPPVAAQ